MIQLIELLHSKRLCVSIAKMCSLEMHRLYPGMAKSVGRCVRQGQMAAFDYLGVP